MSVHSRRLLAVSYGGGTNSTAMLCGFRERDIIPGLILFADTGAEMPHTYEHVELMRGKVREWWGIELEIVRKLRSGEFEGLDGECERGHKMPALAYGSRACSVKYKQQPQNRRIREVMKLRRVPTVTKAIGFDAGEYHRVKPSPDKWAVNWYPLVDWQWRRPECVAAICRHGLPQPGKSACFFCPAMKKREVVALRDSHPELMARALAIEDAAQATIRTPRGLGGDRNRWRDWLAAYDAQGRFDGMDAWIEPHHSPCGCYDGGDEVTANIKSNNIVKTGD